MGGVTFTIHYPISCSDLDLIWYVISVLSFNHTKVWPDIEKIVIETLRKFWVVMPRTEDDTG